MAQKGRGAPEFWPTWASKILKEEDYEDERISSLFLVEELTTDDGLTLSGSDLRDARSNWLLDLVSIGRSLLLARIAGRLGFVTLWATFSAVVLSLAPEDWGLDKTVHVASWPVELVGGFLSILLVFRTDQAYQRFWEGRERWAQVAGSLREITRVAVVGFEGETLDEVLGHVCGFPVALKQHLRGARNVAELDVIWEAFGIAGLAPRSKAEVARVSSIIGANNMPLTLLTSLSVRLRPLAKSNDEQVRKDREVMEESIKALAQAVSDCEKLRCTPIPLSYSRHSSRFFTLFSLLLPLALLETQSPWIVPPMTLFIAWILFATEEIGHLIEEPFGRGLQEFQPAPKLTEVKYKEVFDFFDVNKSGSIDKVEFFVALQKLGLMVPIARIEGIVREYDANDNDLIEYEEFRSVLRECFRLQDVPTGKGGRDGDKSDEDGREQGEESTKGGLLGGILAGGARAVFGAVGDIAAAMDIQEAKGRVKQLEVLPLDRYCLGIHRDVLQQAVFVSTGEKRSRFIKIASDLSPLGGISYDWTNTIAGSLNL